MTIQKKWIEILENNLFIKNGTCPICGKVLFITPHFLCHACDDDLARIKGPTCENCGRPNLENRCGVCKSHGFLFAGGYAWLDYNQSGKELVKAIKFKDRSFLGQWAGTQMAKGLLNEGWLDKIDLIIPVPLHKNRLEERGYNQSEKIARGILQGLKDSQREIFLPHLFLKSLVRIRDTPHQIGRGREERRINLEKAFQAEEIEQLKGKSILLVDDVLTTGSTLGEAGKILLEAGALEIYTAVLCAVVG